MPKLFLNGDRLEFVPVHRYLGLFISESLNCTNFIDSVVNSAFKKLNGLLKKNSSSKLAEKNLSKVYITLIRPMLEYASIVWDGCSKQYAV